MGNNKQNDKDRRWFFSFFLGVNKEETGVTEKGSEETVKMLTAEGRLVEVKRSVLEAMRTNKKASNKDIYNWMDNPSKDKNS